MYEDGDEMGAEPPIAPPLAAAAAPHQPRVSALADDRDVQTALACRHHAHSHASFSEGAGPRDIMTS